MSESLIVQFVGYEVHALDREYRFTVREPKKEPREFTVTISTEAFDGRRARFQDAPDICSVRLRRELSGESYNPLMTSFRITDQELDDYRGRHSPKTSQSPYKKKVAEDY